MKYTVFIFLCSFSANIYAQAEEQYNKVEYNQVPPSNGSLPANVMEDIYKKKIIADNSSLPQSNPVLATVNCSKFKEGKFRINDARAGGVIIAERKGGYQTESMEVLKAVVRFKIVWQDECSYTLTLDKVIRNENKVPFPEDMVIKVTIVSAKDNLSYTQQASSSVTNGMYKSDVIKIQ